MSGGVAVRANLLCVTWSAALGHVFLYDVEARQRVSAWTLPPCEKGFSDAAGVAMDEHFHLFVADPHNERVRHFSVFGRHLGDLGRSAPGSGDAGRDRPGVLDRPHAVAVRGDTVFVASGDQPRRHAVQRFRRSGQVATALYSCGDVEQRFAAPRALWVDAAGILVADTLRGRVQRFRGDGTFVAAVSCGDDERLARPVAVVRRVDGSMIVVDRGDEPGVALFAADGRRRVVPADLVQRCEHVIAMTADERGRLYVLDRHGERVLRFRADLGFDQVIVDLAEHAFDYEPGGGDA
ncbi:MAG: hypothetical protein KDC98_13235 [Planctomycetes bacterium]|nr:hypothetical protein [Planctomycetota bacterium]